MSQATAAVNRGSLAAASKRRLSLVAGMGSLALGGEGAASAADSGSSKGSSGPGVKHPGQSAKHAAGTAALAAAGREPVEEDTKRTAAGKFEAMSTVSNPGGNKLTQDDILHGVMSGEDDINKTVFSTAFSPDDKCIFASMGDGSVKMMCAEKLTLLRS
jgi:hypothetical protein